MVTVSLQPFAFRKIALLIAALVWLTSAVVFADPLFMNAHASDVARRLNANEPVAAGAFTVRRTNDNDGHMVVRHCIEPIDLAPPAEAPPFSLSLSHVDTWHVAATRDNELTFWSMSLRH